MNSGFDDSSATVIPTSPWSRFLSRILQWRHWRLWAKLTALVLVPMIFAGMVSILQIADLTQQSRAYSRLDGVVRTAISVRSLVTALQEERTATAGYLANDAAPDTGVLQRFAVSNRAIRVEASRHNHGVAATRSAHDEAERQLADLVTLRSDILARRVAPMTAVGAYTGVIQAWLALDRALIGEMSSVPLSSAATTQHELARVEEELQLQRALMLVGLLRGSLPPGVLAALGDSETRGGTAFRELLASAPSQERAVDDRIFGSADIRAFQDAVHGTLMPSGGPIGTQRVQVGTWEQQARSAVDAVTAEETARDAQLQQAAFELQDHASNMAGTEAVIFLSALLVTSAIVFVVTRQLLGSLDLLRRSALDTANAQLPRAVRNLRTGVSTTVDRVPVDTGEEIGEVARAFDAVHAQAINLASEQAELRKNYRDSFVNVSRRSQSLLERQLRLFEQLERDEEDPDQLATLFQLDHLATRMRRNNENLMVLSGADLARRFTKPTRPADVLRAAVSEIEHYPRVIIQPLPDIEIAGNAASDMVRLLAELLDNATSFSSPESTVTVSGHLRGDGCLGIDIVDRGIGMRDDELTHANRRLATHGGIELSTSRRLGLFVVGVLSARHGIGVELCRGAENVGVRAVVTVGAELLPQAAPVQAVSATNGGARLTAPPLGYPPLKELEYGRENGSAPSPAPTRNGFHLLSPGQAPDRPEQHAWREDLRDEPFDLFRPSCQSTPDELDAAEAPTESDLVTPIFDNLASAWFQISAARGQGHAYDEDESLRWPARPADDPDTDRYEDSANGTSSHQDTDVLDLHTNESTMDERVASHEREPDPAAHWNFSSDQPRLRAENVLASEPADYTAAGLPRRTPQAHLIAGSAHSASESSRWRPEPNVTRGRLMSFQQGLQRGRHRLNEPDTEARAAPGNPMDSRQPREQRRFSADAHGTEHPDTSFDYTLAGLPRRNPGAPSADAAPISGSATHWDASSVRGRLTSFQRGVREGRHSLGDRPGGHR